MGQIIQHWRIARGFADPFIELKEFLQGMDAPDAGSPLGVCGGDW